MAIAQEHNQLEDKLLVILNKEALPNLSVIYKTDDKYVAFKVFSEEGGQVYCLDITNSILVKVSKQSNNTGPDGNASDADPIILKTIDPSQDLLQRSRSSNQDLLQKQSKPRPGSNKI